VKNHLSMILILGVVAAASGPIIVALCWEWVHRFLAARAQKKSDR
jgi:membrane-associated protein